MIRRRRDHRDRRSPFVRTDESAAWTAFVKPPSAGRLPRWSTPTRRSIPRLRRGRRGSPAGAVGAVRRPAGRRAARRRPPRALPRVRRGGARPGRASAAHPAHARVPIAARRPTLGHGAAHSREPAHRRSRRGAGRADGPADAGVEWPSRRADTPGPRRHRRASAPPPRCPSSRRRPRRHPVVDGVSPPRVASPACGSRSSPRPRPSACEPTLAERPLAVVRGAPPVTRVVEANAAAREAGVAPGMTESEARARCPHLVSPRALRGACHRRSSTRCSRPRSPSPPGSRTRPPASSMSTSPGWAA